jgi:hypothetical protein
MTPFLDWPLIRVRSGWIQTRNVARISARNCSHISTTNGAASLPLLHLGFSKQPRDPQPRHSPPPSLRPGLGHGHHGFVSRLHSARVLCRSGRPSYRLAEGSPFEFEVGFHDGAWRLLGFLCLWIGGPFRLATGLGWSFFIFGATYIHVDQMAHEGKYGPYNFLTMFSDGCITVWLLILLYLYLRWVGFQEPGVAST